MEKIPVNNSENICEFCKMETYTRKHHLIPRCKNGKITANTCPTCEGYIHSTWNNNELRDIYNTPEAILATEKFQKFLKWRRKQSATVLFKSDAGKYRKKGKFL
jgi:hypothetical protein